MDHLIERICQLYEVSSCPAVIADREMAVVYANKAAIDRYPVLSLPGGLSLLFPQAQLQELGRAIQETKQAQVMEPVGITRIEFCFAPIEDHYFISIESALLEQSANGQSVDFLASVVNDQIRTPLSNIFSSIFAMARLPEAEPGSRLFDLIEQVNRNSYQMLRFSLDFNTYLLDALGNRPIHSEMLDLTTLLSQLGQAAGMLTQTVGIPLRLSLPIGPVYVEADERRLSHALLHMISNSCRFTQENNEIELSLTQAKDQALISISDRGRGIPKELQERICDPFFSHDPDGEPFAGSGLGLSVARHIIAQHKGSFAITSQEGKGTTVAVGIPVANPGRLTLKSPVPVVDLLRDRFSMVHIILSDCCGVPRL